MLVGDGNDQDFVVPDGMQKFIGEALKQAFADFSALYREGERVLRDAFGGIANLGDEACAQSRLLHVLIAVCFANFVTRQREKFDRRHLR